MPFTSYGTRRVPTTTEKRRTGKLFPARSLARFRRKASWTSAAPGMKKTCRIFPPIPRGCSPRNSQRKTTLLIPGDVVVVDFPGVMGLKRRPAVVLSSDVYHSDL